MFGEQTFAQLRTGFTPQQEEEEVWGPVVEYRLLQPIEVELNFPLQDVVETLYELVLRLLATDTGGTRDVTLDVKEVSAFLGKKVVVCGLCLVPLSLTINETLKWLSSLPILL